MNNPAIPLLLAAVFVSTAQDQKPAAPKSDAPATSKADKKKPVPATNLEILETEVHFRSVLQAIEQFQRDYDRLPQPVSAVKGADCFTDTSSEEQLIAILKGSEEEQNSRRFDYMGEIKVAVEKGGRFYNGIRKEGDEIELLDLWGHHFRVLLDLDFDGAVEDPSAAADAKGDTGIKKAVITWSAGPDGDFDTWEDNLCSWK